MAADWDAEYCFEVGEGPQSSFQTPLRDARFLTQWSSFPARP